MPTTLTILTGLVYAVIELLKAGMKSFGILADDNQRAFVVRILAVAVGIAATVALQVDALHADAPTLAGMVITGAALAIASDILQIGTDFGKAKAAQAEPVTFDDGLPQPTVTEQALKPSRGNWQS